MSTLSLASLGLWMLFGIYGFLSRESVKIHGIPANSFMRTMVWLLFYPVVGVLFLILGAIGKFMAAPLVDLLAIAMKGVM